MLNLKQLYHTIANRSMQEILSDRNRGTNQQSQIFSYSRNSAMMERVRSSDSFEAAVT